MEILLLINGAYRFQQSMIQDMQIQGTIVVDGAVVADMNVVDGVVCDMMM